MKRRKKQVTTVANEENRLAVKFDSKDEHTITPPENVKHEEWIKQLHATLGTSDTDALNLFISQVIGIINPGDEQHAIVDPIFETVC